MMDAMKVAAVLRRAAENAGCGLHEVMSDGGDCPEISCNGCREASAAWANEAADAIERCALPGGVEWPSVGGRKVDFKTAYEPGLGVLEAVCIYSNGACEVMSHDGIRKPVSEIRPAVLAADGEPLEVGQTVYGTRDLEPVEIVSLRSKEYDGVHTVKCKDRTGFVFYAPDDLIHQRPVLDADGVPIKAGDTVYEADGSGHAFKVVGIRTGDGSLIGQTVVTCDVGYGTSEHFLPINKGEMWGLGAPLPRAGRKGSAMKGAAATVAALLALMVALFGVAFFASLGWHLGAAVVA